MTITTDLGTDLSQPNHPKNCLSNPSNLAALLMGAGLATLGLSRRGWLGMGLAAGGAYIAYQGVTRAPAQPIGIRVAFTINRSPQELYEIVRDQQNWSTFTEGVQLTRQDGQLKLVLGRSLGREISSTIEITDEQEGKYIAWSSLPGMIEHRGVVRFRPAPGNRGTELTVAAEFKIPGGSLIRGAAMVQGRGPEQLVRETLRRLKQFVEAGEIPTTVGQPSGARGLKGSALRVVYRESTQKRPPEGVPLATESGVRRSL
jgi:uncharacterized membrane protein